MNIVSLTIKGKTLTIVFTQYETIRLIPPIGDGFIFSIKQDIVAASNYIARQFELDTTKAGAMLKHILLAHKASQ